METFGSDAAPPNITSVRRVRECDIFVGIYARRYGAIDEVSGRSITEFELDEAKNARGTPTLLYCGREARFTIGTNTCKLDVIHKAVTECFYGGRCPLLYPATVFATRLASGLDF